MVDWFPCQILTMKNMTVVTPCCVLAILIPIGSSLFAIPGVRNGAIWGMAMCPTDYSEEEEETEEEEESEEEETEEEYEEETEEEESEEEEEYEEEDGGGEEDE